ncbi:MAG: hypothetical protein D6806_12070 [Deltaproteobacteria bacterium]|nr:MAG: hypothetical protein D6806_12070 [Deltaproteobacteria bacterium]
MRCPKCNSEMKKVTVRKIEVDRCPSCGGIFLDKGELEAIDDADIGAVFDRGAWSRQKPEMDEVEAFCHRCRRTMMKLRAAGDVNIDWCDQCEGVFLDRGELAALDLYTDSD